MRASLLGALLLSFGCSVVVDPDPGRLGGDAGTDTSTSTDSATDTGGDAPSCSPEACSDGIECTVDACVADSCTNTPDSALCPMGTRCDPTMGCVDARCDTDDECDDGNACNGSERCVANLCVSGERVVCDDGIECTADICDPDSGSCSTALEDAACNDEIGCTIDRCTAEGCTYEPNNDACDDGLCAVGGRCVVGEGCVGGMERSCDDENACTIDACDPSDGECRNVEADRDRDMVMCSLDCDDDDDTVGEPRDELCNGIDDDCDGVIDNGVCNPDTCDSPQTLDVTAGEVSVSAPFRNFTDSYETQCDAVDGDGRDAVYAVRIPDGSALLINATAVGSGSDTVLAVSTECGAFDGFAGRGCNDDARRTERGSRIWVHGFGGETVYILVDEFSAGDESDGFELEVEAFEDTDDTCREEFDISGGGTVVGRTLDDLTASRRATCGASTGTGGADATFQFDTEPGTARLQVWSDDYRPIVHASIECTNEPFGGISCNAGDPARIDFSIDDDRLENYSVFVDGFTRDADVEYTLTFQVR